MYRILVLSLFVLAAASAPAYATDVAGNINTDTRWSTAGSPYRLTGDVIVAPLATLTIDPGVVVEAAATDGLGSGTDAARVELIVRGALAATGTPSSSITFRGVSAGVGTWYGIAFDPGAQPSSLAFATIQDAQYGIWVRSTSSILLSDLSFGRGQTAVYWQASPGPTLTRVTVREHRSVAIRIEDDGASGATALVEQCALLDNLAEGLLIAQRVDATVKRSHIVHNRRGLELASGGALQLENNVVAANWEQGLGLTQSGTNAISIVNNTIDKNVADIRTAANPATSPGTGIWIHAVTDPSSFIVRNNIVTSHGTAGIRVDGATQPVIDHNDVWGNGTNYQGTSGGVGAISANPLFVTPAAATGTWQFVADARTWSDTGSLAFTYTFENLRATLIRARFGSSSIYDASCTHDRLNLFDRAGLQVGQRCGSFTGSYPSAVVGSYLRMSYYDDGAGHTGSVNVQGYEHQPLASYNYRLQPSSLAIDVGSDLDVPLEDADGTARPYDGDVNGTATTDMGAYEWHDNVPPYASAGPDHLVLTGTTIAFDSVGSNDPDGTIAAWQWDFGDGSPFATTPTASHTYATVGTYTVTLTVTDDMGATATDTATVSVVTNLPPQAVAGPDQYVAPATVVQLDGGGSTDPDGAIVAYAWSFGDGSPNGSGRTVSHLYAAAGVYVATLTVTDNMGATASDSAYIIVGGGGGGVNSPPTAEAGPNRSADLGVSITLDGTGSTDSDGTIVTYTWDFGDGTTGSGSTASHAWSAAGNYLVQLTVTDNQGATDDDFTLVVVTDPAAGGNQPPVAEAGANQTTTIGTFITLDGSTSSDPDGTIAAYAWDFGDGTTGSGATASHAWSAAGTFLVTLTVTDDLGAVDQDFTLVVVTDSSSGGGNALPTAEAGPNRSADVGASITLDGTGSSDADGSITAYAWDFGDGATGSGSMATHAWSAAGSYLVRLTVTDDQGATDDDFTLVVVTDPAAGNQAPNADAGPNRTTTIGTAITLDGSASSDPDGTIAAYAWSFGDGTTGTGATASHAWSAAGSYLVRLTVTDNLGATDEDFTLVVITDSSSGGGNAPPVAEAGPNRTATVGIPLTLDGSGSTDADGTLVAYAWDFGDGASGTGATASHAWSAAGSYLVKLTVTDDGGATDDDFALVVVADPAAGNAPPVAEAGPPRSALAGEVVSLDGTASADSDGTIATWAWDFGDDTTASTATASHAWTAAGTYLVKLSVTDDDGAVGQDYTVVTVRAAGGANQPPVAASGADLSGMTGQAVAFDGSTSSDPDGSIVAYLWDFGDGDSAVGKTVSHVYENPGAYTATLTVIDNDGASASDTVVATIAKGAGGGCACGVGPGGGVSLPLLAGVLALLGSAIRRRRD